MYLSHFLPQESIRQSGFSDLKVGKPCADTRLLQKKDVFFSENSASYIEKAVQKGASAVITSREMPELSVKCPVFRVESPRKAYALAWQAYTDHPEKDFRFFAVTGTNGKTSVAHFLSELFRMEGYTVGKIGTVQNFDGKTYHPAEYTTPPPELLYPLLQKMRENGVTHVVMEASSHAIVQDRLFGLPFESAIFTNLTRDHLDYHKTEDAYKAAKAKLFQNAKNAVLNGNDPAAKDMAWNASGDVYYYAEAPSAEFEIRDPLVTTTDIRYHLRIGNEYIPLALPLVGGFHIENSAAAIAAASLAGISTNRLKKAATHLFAPEGRLEKLHTDTKFTIYIDYAHTPDALSHALSALRPLTKHLTVLFGAGGDRDRGKRAEMGAAADRIADHIILTSDNPRTEDPLAIIKDVAYGIQSKPYTPILDRKEAIEYALSHAKEGDILLFAGKGHETYIIDKNGKHHFSEREIVYQYLERKGQENVSQHE